MAKFTFCNLTENVRQWMMDEIKTDLSEGRLYLSDRLNADGLKVYQTFLFDSVNSGDEESFQLSLESGMYFNPTELRNGKTVKVPSNAAQLLSQSEFNRFYIRAVCLLAISQGIDKVEIYRARDSSWKRPESEIKIGTFLNPTDLLNDLRSSIGKEPSLFPEINSGLCIKVTVA